MQAEFEKPTSGFVVIALVLAAAFVTSLVMALDRIDRRLLDRGRCLRANYSDYYNKPAWVEFKYGPDGKVTRIEHPSEVTRNEYCVEYEKP